MIDITQGIRELDNVSKVWVISAKNECKEVLFLVEKGFEGNTEIVATEISSEKTIEVKQQEATAFSFSEPLKYLYDPIVQFIKLEIIIYSSTVIASRTRNELVLTIRRCTN